VEGRSEFKIFPTSAKIRESLVRECGGEKKLLFHLLFCLLQICQTGFERLDGLKVRILSFVEFRYLRFERGCFVTVSINTILIYGERRGLLEDVLFASGGRLLW